MPAGQVAYNTPTKNPYYDYQQGSDLGYQEHLQNLIFGIAPEKSGLYQFMQGGRYSPEALMRMAPTVAAPAPGALQGYARGFMDPVAAQNALLASQLSDVGPRVGTTAGRLAAAQQLGRGLSANIGQAGVAGASQGLDALLRAGLANQQSRLGLLQQGVGQAYGASGDMAQAIINAITGAQARREQLRMQTRQQNQAILGQLIQAGGRIAGAAVTGGLSEVPSFVGGAYENFPGAYSNQDFYQMQMDALRRQGGGRY